MPHAFSTCTSTRTAHAGVLSEQAAVAMQRTTACGRKLDGWFRRHSDPHESGHYWEHLGGAAPLAVWKRRAASNRWRKCRRRSGRRRGNSTASSSRQRRWAPPPPETPRQPASLAWSRTSRLPSATSSITTTPAQRQSALKQCGRAVRFASPRPSPRSCRCPSDPGACDPLRAGI